MLINIKFIVSDGKPCLAFSCWSTNFDHPIWNWLVNKGWIEDKDISPTFHPEGWSATWHIF